MGRPVWAALAAIALAAGARADDHKHAAKGDANPALEKLKKLAGEWVAVDDKGKPTDQVVSVFKVTAAGSAVHETIFPGAAHEMVSVYHLDGKDLLMNHYCALGNQPRMKLDPKGKPNELKFVFAGGTNLDPAKDMHMHEGSITLVDDDHIEWTWSGYADGKKAEGHTVSMKLARKKK
ncbi:MAG TPA: hypothetical protein VKD90_18975 [Gemmataceae bacterium]|nr:hypothetical protein [Gemmataceae bacterium]